MKNFLKKSCKFCLLMVTLLIMSITVNAQALSLTYTNDTTELSKEYSWSFKFIDGKTTVESSGMTNYAADAKMTTNLEDVDFSALLSARLTSDSQKGNIWVRYNNVGTYNGQVVDLKITLTDWDYLQPANTSASSTIGGVNYPTVFFGTDEIIVYITGRPAVSNPEYTYTFYVHGTDTEISINGHFTFQDMDGASSASWGSNEYVIPETNLLNYYVTASSSTYLTVSGNKIINPLIPTTTNEDKNAWVTMFWSGSSFSFIYGTSRSEYTNSYYDVTATAGAANRGAYHFLTSSESVAPVEFTDITKSVDKTNITGGDTITYTITQNIPGESSDYYYTSWVLTDAVPSCLAVQNVKVTDDSTTRTSWFNVSTSNNTVTVTAKSSTLSNSLFYNNNINVVITAKLTDGCDLSSYYSSSKSTIPNTASVTISGPTVSSTRTSTIKSNTVNVSAYYKVITSMINGTITPSATVVAGSDMTVTWKPYVGYYVSSIDIDGTTYKYSSGSTISVDGTTYNITGSSSYDFTNIATNHIISVVAEPYYFTLKGNKIDSETYNEAQGDATLGGAVIAVYYHQGYYTDSEEPYDEGEIVCQATTNDDGSFECDEQLRAGYYEIKELVAPEGYELNINSYYFTQTDDSTVEYNLSDEVQKYTLELIKTMSDGTTGLVETEPNAEFEIYLKSTGELVTTITTDANGKATADLPYGIYTVKQVAGAENYYMADEFEVNLKSEDQSVVINNSELTAKLKLVKVDADTGNVITLSNIKFKIWSVEDNDWVSFKITYPSVQTIDVFETDETGSFTTPSVLGSGTYIIYEVEDQTIDGYLWNDEGVEFEITFDTELDEDEDGNNIVLIYFGNTAVKGSVELTKTGETLVCENGECAYTFELLEGVTFGIYAREDITDGTGAVIYSADDLVAEIATDENGVASIGGLYLGKYYFKEISTIENYILDETEYDFELTYEDQYTSEVTYATTIKNYYDKTTVKFYKKDLADEAILLAGAEICVYTVDGDLVECIKTDEDGFAAIALPIGEYYYIETVAPEGYQLDPETYYFSITDSGQTLVVDVLNEFLIVNAPNTNISNWQIVVSTIMLIMGSSLVFGINKSVKKKAF